MYYLTMEPELFVRDPGYKKLPPRVDLLPLSFGYWRLFLWSETYTF